VVADGQLWNLPFQALTAPSGPHVVEDAAVFYAPSLTALREVRRRPAGPASHELLAFAGQDPPGAAREVRELGALYGNGKDAAVFLGAQAGKERWKMLAADYRVLHLATHGVLDSSAPLYSYLSLPGDDGRLTAREILDLRLNADLTVLSACGAARGNFRAGEGLIGMSWAFLVAGSPPSPTFQC
jgi:CHAT domain-containing protein